MKFDKYTFFAIWLVFWAIVVIITGFLPMILSIYYANWWYMEMYRVIAAPILFEIVIFSVGVKAIN